MTASPVKKRYIQHVAISHHSSNKSPLQLELSVRETGAGRQAVHGHTQTTFNSPSRALEHGAWPHNNGDLLQHVIRVRAA
jgi:hypothetical protein